jgi:hypothetical protein
MSSAFTKSCEACGGLVSLAAPACPHCGHPQRQVEPAQVVSAPLPAKAKSGGVGKYVMLGIGGLILVMCIANRDHPSGEPAPAAPRISAPVQPAAPPQPSEADRLTANMPPSQQRFLDIISAGQRAWNAGANEMQKGASRPARAQALCAGPIPVADRWVGRVKSLSTNNEGRGVLAIVVAAGVVIKTWNNALSDIGSDTLLVPGSEVFSAAAAMRAGQLVRFNAALARSPTDCLSESSMTIRGSMMEPEFIARFSRIEPL